MVISGLKLMAIGMGVVFVYLTVMIILIQFTATLLRTSTLREENEQKAAAAPPKSGAEGTNKSKLVAVISAAIQKHRSKS